MLARHALGWALLVSLVAGGAAAGVEVRVCGEAFSSAVRKRAARMRVAAHLFSPPSTKKNLGDLLSKDSLKMHALGLLNAGQAAVDTGHVFTLYSVRFKRTTVGDGGVGTQIFSVYDVYPAPPGEDVPIIGRQYYVSTVIDSPPGGTEETRQSIYSFKIFPNASKVVAECCSEIDGFIAALKQAAADKNGVAVPTNDLEAIGVGNYPAGEGLVSSPLVASIVGGTGAWYGARGQLQITRDPTPPGTTYTLKFHLT